MARYRIIACHVLWREICHFASTSKNVFDFVFLEQGLHDTPDILRERVQEAVDDTPDDYDAILLGYALCSNGIDGITARHAKLVVPRAHDCITLLLGSKERYREYFDAHPGTYWYSPGWIDNGRMPGKERHEELLREYTEKHGADNAEYLMEMEQSWIKEYSKAAYIDLGFMDTEEYKRYTKECADWLGWAYDEIEGDSGLLKRFLSGDWDNNDFLVIEPGSKVIASHDDGVICCSATCRQ